MKKKIKEKVPTFVYCFKHNPLTEISVLDKCEDCYWEDGIEPEMPKEDLNEKES